ncbi:DNA (cytosine-5-)-methyltransferase [Staphylococcus pseudintermedius]|uniref:DNA (cytosine-5-)-methyltransferase n=1 Tax=Staphylococcus pseudintermedius TaxID=283734 RepID=UPI0007AEC4D5|nr:DNA (cytosine-5-)-methyltransferase [Staphylococcus pseudintermedius]EGQ0310552.1 DNA (cytosine-5-)-methyltransferase [Staphylococcus pseudintermedius]EGQ1621261.1 DNA (cytosine-5-)-methyltransferase [Staphylococcus pseudintermedius]EGQ1656237.1 DNA (cytosine-5-)-methyltransferase [Staphylococcus pseudintermedius]EGQ3260938.1 DNA (cytosine-5-)-methyltransferase [Staphylococcus pseudintermedius]EGQ3399753.1 DNA (cytosine-5-)-methyltransferase [Staphylococcus pseudintermedius]
MNNLKVVELFAGVGGFRLGLEQTKNQIFDVNWANQWEPSRKVQHAFDCYNQRFSNGKHVNRDIAEVSDIEMAQTNADMIVGGFPCQDYSVARSLRGELGIEGKKGVLFWQIIRFVQNTYPKYLLLENVDRLLKSPSNQRGRDFAVMLSTLNELGYDIEWRVINAADYGNAQRRRRVFIFGYKQDLNYSKQMEKELLEDIIYKKGMFAQAFPIENEPNKKRIAQTTIWSNIAEVSDKFKFQFYNSGIMRGGKILTIDTIPKFEKPLTLQEIIEENVDEIYSLSNEQIEKFRYLRGPKKIKRTTKDGHEYYFSEGGMSETDSLDLPARTMLTSEGSVNRSTHFLNVNNNYRTLTPVEAERLNGFPDNWTDTMPDRMRFFCMGNALVVPIITRIGNQIEKIEKLNGEFFTQLKFF